MAVKKKVSGLKSDADDVVSSSISKKKANKKSLFVSTGSTLLDLAISGKITKYGGIPSGILVEIYGPSSSGKTAVLVEAAANAAFHGGEVRYQDPEARLNKEYMRLYGLDLKDQNYFKPDTVSEVMASLAEWEPERTDVVNIDCVDSLAALSTDLEMEKGDKMGMRRAKELSEGLRKVARKIAHNNRLILCTNQVRQGDYGEVTPGGKAVEYYASLRLRIAKVDDVEREMVLDGMKKKIKKVIGIKSNCFVKKSSVDDPFRSAPIFIMFNHGIDDLRANLQYLKDMREESTYNVDGKTYKSMEQAIKAAESKDLEEDIREEVIALWNEVEDKFAVSRKPKARR